MPNLSEQEILYNKIDDKTTIQQIQEYIEKVITIRGFSKQTVQDKMYLLY